MARLELFQLRRIRNTLYKPALVSVYNLHTTNTGIWVTRAFQFVPDVSRQTGEPPTACWTCLPGSSSIRAYPPQLSPPPHIVTYPLFPPSIQTTSICSRTRPWQSTQTISGILDAQTLHSAPTMTCDCKERMPYPPLEQHATETHL